MKLTFCTISVVLFMSITVCSASKLVLNNNGYEGLTIIIRDNVPEREFNGLIESIKLRFTEASNFLFRATERRAYFRHITIVIPSSWKSVSTEKVSSINVFSEHIRVEPTNSTFPSPYVRGNLECGKPAWYMRVDPKWLFGSQTDDGVHEKVIVHEWGHLRWGLFDEYASINHKKWRNPGHKIYFDSLDQDGQPKPVACTGGIQGEAKRNCNSQEVCSPKDALEDPDCKFCPYLDQPNVRASVMSYQYITGVENFCDMDRNSVPENLRHDPSTRSAQNEYCNGKSAWEVMREHDDFRNGNNLPVDRSQTVDTTPTFRIIQEGGRSRVFVFDVSGSMSGDKIIQQKDAADLAIDTIIQIGSCLGIVQFTDVATTKAPMTHIRDLQTKVDLKDKVPSVADGGTQILLGLREAINVIERAQQPCSSTTKGAEIVLLSDGESNDPYLEEISPVLVEKNIIVHTVAITSSADPDMTELAKRTGGKSFTFLQTQTVSFSEAFAETLTTNDISSTFAEKVLSKTKVLSRESPVRGSLVLEEGLGNQTTITAEMNSSVSAVLTLLEPGGSILQMSDIGRKLVIQVPGTADVGTYNFTLETQSSSPVRASFAIYSQPVSTEVEIVRVTSRLSNDTVDFNVQEEVKLYVEVIKGVHPVLNANVTAVLDAGAGFEPELLVLDDNGKGADTQQSDGIYSVYLVKKFFKMNSPYNIKVSVTDSDESIIYTEDIGLGSGGAALLPTALSNLTYTPVPVEKFQRQSIPPLISVVNFIDDPPDTTPPARIIDLDVVERLEKVEDNDPSSDSITFMLIWTAVGDDMTVGQATEYEMRISDNVTMIRTQFQKNPRAPVNLTVPLSSGEPEAVNLTLFRSDCNGTCYLAMRSRDAAGQWSEVSNILPVIVVFLEDTTPPARIIDLDVVERWEKVEENAPSSSSITFMLTWTAVGDDMTVGQATEYELRISDNLTMIRTQFEKNPRAPVHLTVPLSSGEPEAVNLTLFMSDCNGTCYLAIRSRDEAGQWSEVSNILSVTVVFLDEPDKVLTEASNIPLAVISAVVVVVVIIVIVALLWYKKRHASNGSNNRMSYNKDGDDVESQPMNK